MNLFATAGNPLSNLAFDNSNSITNGVIAEHAAGRITRPLRRQTAACHPLEQGQSAAYRVNVKTLTTLLAAAFGR